MNDNQIDFLISILRFTKLKVFFKDEGTLVPVLSVQKDFVDKDADCGESVAWLGGPNSGKCVALSCVEPTDFQVISSGECF
jgi:hypothetical protein